MYATVPDPSSVCVCVSEEGSATPDYGQGRYETKTYQCELTVM